MSPFFHHCLRNTLQSQGTTGRKLVSHSNMQRLLFKQGSTSQKPFPKEFSAENHFPGGQDLKIQACTKANMNQVNRCDSLNLYIFNHN